MESGKGGSRFGNWADPEIVELSRMHSYLDLARAHGEYLSISDDPTVWSDADWEEFERDRAAFERYHGG